MRESDLLWWLRSDGKAQVMIEYVQRTDGSVEPRDLDEWWLRRRFHAELLDHSVLPGLDALEMGEAIGSRSIDLE